MSEQPREPLSAARIEEWRQTYAEPSNGYPGDRWALIAIIRALLADDDRLRAELAEWARLAGLREGQRDEALEIVRAVATLPLDDTCLIDDPDATEHAPDCWVSQARVLLAQVASGGPA